MTNSSKEGGGNPYKIVETRIHTPPTPDNKGTMVAVTAADKEGEEREAGFKANEYSADSLRILSNKILFARGDKRVRPEIEDNSNVVGMLVYGLLQYDSVPREFVKSKVPEGATIFRDNVTGTSILHDLAKHKFKFTDDMNRYTWELAARMVQIVANYWDYKEEQEEAEKLK